MSLSASDLFLSQDLTEEQARAYLASIGFRDPAAADHHLQAMADELVVRETLGSMARELLDGLLGSPNPDAALVGFSRYVATRTSRKMFLEYLRDDPRALHVLAEVLGTSPSLSEILIRDPDDFVWLVNQLDRRGPYDLAHELDEQDPAEGKAEDRLDGLKRFKRRETLRIAARDLFGRDTLEAATAQLSDLAGLVTERALAVTAGRLLATAGLDRPPGSFVVMGMGKLGGRELNYSSDIDLIYAYEPEQPDDSGAHAWFHKLAKGLTAALSEHTAESYLYRVDLRLRPNGRRGAIAYSLQEVEQYYTSWGETFERFALIKARPIAGDLGLGRRFLDLVQPFVYRKYLDHAALEEMHRYKTRMDRALPRADGDRNVKLGRGGIREIELFTQVLQLTYGGNIPALRQPNTLAALSALRDAGLVPAETQADLSRAYAFLREVEHRLQIVHQGQTHTLSSAPAELEITARRLGYQSGADLLEALERHRDRVHAIYRDLFERRRGTSQFHGREYFRILSEDASEEEALAHLREQGFRDSEAVLHAIRALGQMAAIAPAPSVARNALANLLATIMPRVARCARPERVLNRLEQVSEPSGAPALWFRSLLENEGLRDTLIEVLDAGDLMADRLVRHPELLDSLLQPPEDLEALARTFDQRLDQVGRVPREDRAVRVRRFKRFEEFKVIVEWLQGGSLDTVQEKLSLLADRCLQCAAAWNAPPLPPGAADEPSWAFAALGRLGGCEMTVHSDLDLVVVYDGDPADSEQFERHQSFVMAVQAFLEKPAAEPAAYRVDTRLRPEGRKGALAVPMATFSRYFDGRADIWERLVWTRRRAVAGSSRLARQVLARVDEFVYGPWNADIPQYMRDVRLRMERELARESDKRADFKVGRGGLADVDFILELVQIREGRTRPEFRIAGTRRLLACLPANPWLTGEETGRLRVAYSFLRGLEIAARTEADADLTWIPTDPEALAPIGTRLYGPDRPGERLLSRYRELTDDVRSIYTAVLARLAE